MPPEQAADPSFLSALWSWLMTKAPNDDVTLLSVIFAFNAGFSTVDSIVGGMIKNLRSKIRHRVCCYTEAKWIRSIAPTDTEKDKVKRSVLTALVKGVTDMQKEIPDMFSTNAFWWKIVMALSAAIALYCMAVPHTQRITLLLALPIPLFMLACRIELRSFNKRFGDACKNLEKERKLITEADASEPEAGDVNSKISVAEEKVKSFEGIKPMPPLPPRSSTPPPPPPAGSFGYRIIHLPDGKTIYVK